MDLRTCGISDTHVLSALERVPRDNFVPPGMSERAFENAMLPMGYGQFMLPPIIIAQMLQSLPRDNKSKILEIGTGSGYMTAILAELYRRVYTIEIISELLDAAMDRWKTLQLSNIVTRHGDGQKGWGEQSPFDAIVITCACSGIPAACWRQLRTGGVMILPLAVDGKQQILTKFVKTKDAYESYDLCPADMIPSIMANTAPNLAVI